MKTLFASVLLLTIVSFSSNAQNTRWQQGMSCEMDVQMDVNKHQFTGKQTYTYENNSPDELNRAYFYLFFNAFQPGSMMDIRSQTIEDPDGRVGNRISKLDPSQQGYMHVTKLTMNGKPVEYKEVGTILECVLPEGIGSEKKAVFELEFNGQVPLQIRRSGRQNEEGIRYSMTQWFPKMCEYDHQGWHATPYVGREFHGVWGDYDVKITIDKYYMIGASGVLQNPEEIGHGYSDKKANDSATNTWHFKAENVIDFAWAADADYTHDIKQVPNGPTMHFIYQNNKEITENWKQMQEYAVKAMEFLSRNLGSLVGVTVHEMAHSWFQGVIATNESLYEWMDEGFTTYASGECMTHLFGDKGNPVNYRSLRGYINLTESGKEEPMSTHADHYATNYAYGQAAYSKGSVFLNQLRYIVGEEAFRAGMLEYFETWGFHHPTPNDFIRIFEKNTHLELDWYLEYFVNSTKTIDYSLEVESSRKQTNIFIKRIGLMPMPLDIVVTMKDGTKHMHHIPMVIMRGEKKEEAGYDSWTVHEDWAWVKPYYDLSLELKIKKIESIEIDPSFRLADVNPNNHIWPVPVIEEEKD